MNETDSARLHRLRPMIPNTVHDRTIRKAIGDGWSDERIMTTDFTLLPSAMAVGAAVGRRHRSGRRS